jgi:glycosyltransferase involved in cell wall biosynthesis
VVEDHCRRSNAGLYYGDRDEFVEALDVLLADPRLRRAMGKNGRDYVRKHYRWEVVLNKYDRLLSALRAR